MSIEFPTAPRARVRGWRHARAAVENSGAAVVHLPKPKLRRTRSSTTLFAKHFIPD
jgi:hypothetical protein